MLLAPPSLSSIRVSLKAGKWGPPGVCQMRGPQEQQTHDETNRSGNAVFQEGDGKQRLVV